MITDLLYILKYQYDRGFKDGIRAFAHWIDGKQFVGTTGKSLEDALKEFEDTWNYTPPTKAE